MTLPPLLDAALDYASRGWPVFPCHNPAVGGACSCGQPDCGSPAKHPRTRHGLHDATVDRDQIRRWWQQHPNANIGVRTGAPSGLIVIDLDLPHGPRRFRELAGGRLGNAAVVHTGSGGTHLYFQAPDDVIVRNSTRRLGAGIDVRGEGGYILAPPSRHHTGRTYAWTTPLDVPTLPPWLQQRLESPTPAPPSRWQPPRDSGRDWATALRDQEVADVATAPVGTRNTTLNRAAFVLGRVAASGALDPHDVRSKLEQAATAAGLPIREAQRTIESGLSAGRETGRSLHR